MDPEPGRGRRGRPAAPRPRRRRSHRRPRRGLRRTLGRSFPHHPVEGRNRVGLRMESQLKAVPALQGYSKAFPVPH
eukprot:10909212-Alexandrium_andersonii.AAC.1